jgi:GMP synthase - Glutamine amidotransferase domain
MKRLRFGLLQAAESDTNTTRNFRRELDADLVEFDVNNGELPPHTEFDALVVTGSRASVYWDDDWIDPLVDYVGEAAADGVPILGVCYGHQVLAEALGGRVAGMDDFELGYNTIEQVDDGPLFNGISNRFTVFTSHGDTVAELPAGGELIARNDHGVRRLPARRLLGRPVPPRVRHRDCPRDRREQTRATR